MKNAESNVNSSSQGIGSQMPHYANIRNGDLVRQPDPWGARIIIGVSLLLVVVMAAQLFAHTVEEVRAMPKHLEGF